MSKEGSLRRKNNDNKSNKEDKIQLANWTLRARSLTSN